MGLTRRPEGYVATPRDYSRGQRAVATLSLTAFATVVVATTVLSLGAYCLTSDGENTRGLPHRPPVTATRR